jgi:hypothetical protein
VAPDGDGELVDGSAARAARGVLLVERAADELCDGEARALGCGAQVGVLGVNVRPDGSIRRKRPGLSRGVHSSIYQPSTNQPLEAFLSGSNSAATADTRSRRTCV